MNLISYTKKVENRYSFHYLFFFSYSFNKMSQNALNSVSNKNLHIKIQSNELKIYVFLLSQKQFLRVLLLVNGHNDDGPEYLPVQCMFSAPLEGSRSQTVAEFS